MAPYVSMSGVEYTVDSAQPYTLSQPLSDSISLSPSLSLSLYNEEQGKARTR